MKVRHRRKEYDFPDDSIEQEIRALKDHVRHMLNHIPMLLVPVLCSLRGMFSLSLLILKIRLKTLLHFFLRTVGQSP